MTGLPVVDTHVARQAGIVSDVLLDLHTGRVAVLNVKHADGWLVQRIPAPERDNWDLTDIPTETAGGVARFLYALMGDVDVRTRSLTP